MSLFSWLKERLLSLLPEPDEIYLPAKSGSIATPAPVARSSATPSDLVRRARSALSHGQLDEKRLASDESYRISKVNEFS